MAMGAVFMYNFINRNVLPRILYVIQLDVKILKDLSNYRRLFSTYFTVVAYYSSVFFFFLLEHICKSCTIVHTYVYMAGRSMIFRAIYSQPMSQHHNRETEIIQSYRKRTSIRSFMKFLFLKYNKIV